MNECNCICHRPIEDSCIGHKISLLCDCGNRQKDPVVCYEMRDKKQGNHNES